MGKIFVSYRRADASAYAGRIYDRLVNAFGDDSIFMDVSTIEPGADFRQRIDAELANSSVMLTIIGPQWTSIADNAGPRLFNQDDLVRYEVAKALAAGLTVIPVLVGGAPVPAESELPGDLAQLCRLQSFPVTHERFGADMSALAQTISESLSSDLSREAILTRLATAVVEYFRQHNFGNLFVAPYIKAEQKACIRRDFPLDDDEPVLAVIDLTMFRTAENSLVFTDRAAYYKRFGAWLIPYNELVNCSFAESKIYKPSGEAVDIIGGGSHNYEFLFVGLCEALRRA